MINFEIGYVKKTFESESLVNYYDEITEKFGLLSSEKICFEKYALKTDRIIDIGCGAGRTTIGLRNIGYTNIIGIDISTKMILKAKSRDKTLEFISADVAVLPFEDNSFDIAFFSFNGLMLIPNISNRILAIKEIKRVLRKKGLFIFSTPFLDNKLKKPFWKQRIINNVGVMNEFEIGDIFIDDMGVENIYIHVPFKKEVEDMLKNDNFSVIECSARHDIFTEKEIIENELDDNLFWIVRSE